MLYRTSYSILDKSIIENNEEYDYESCDIKWKMYKSSIPKIIRKETDIDKVKLYVESKDS